MDTERIIEKLDAYLGRNDYAGAERHLHYWIGDALSRQDRRDEFTLRNELMGLCRKLGKKEDALMNMERTLELGKTLGLEHTVSWGTALVNAATVCKAFSMPERSIALFEQASACYEALLPDHDGRLAALQNNMALTLMDLGRLDEAESAFRKALSVLAKRERAKGEEAITWLNLADLQAMRGASPEILRDRLENARAALEDKSNVYDGNYAFIIEKCAPVFGHYGYNEYKDILLKRAKDIYERA